jgi:hypothetical protein
MMQCEGSFVNDDSRVDLVAAEERLEKNSQRPRETRYSSVSTYAWRSRRC